MGCQEWQPDVLKRLRRVLLPHPGVRGDVPGRIPGGCGGVCLCVPGGWGTPGPLARSPWQPGGALGTSETQKPVGPVARWERVVAGGGGGGGRARCRRCFPGIRAVFVCSYVVHSWNYRPMSLSPPEHLHSRSLLSCVSPGIWASFCCSPFCF